MGTDSIVKIVKPSGTLDGTVANQFRREISDSIETGARVFLINLQAVTFMDSSGLGALVSALKMVRVAGGRLAVCSINDRVEMLFTLTGMHQVFEIFASQDEFDSAVLSAI